jgi:hypothetical protein
MIPSTTTIERTTNMVGEESIAMSIDTDSLAFLMSTLSNLYSDNELAVLRELSTNARDAMIAAGKADQPIEVLLPNSFRQSLIIKDTGLGMDISDLRNTYSKYGASSKRQSNDYNGVLGLGSKSPFTITDSYTVTAVKNGVKTAVLVSRSEEGGGTMEVIAQTPTDEVNSVEINIPTKRHMRFAERAKNFFAFWEPGTVLVDGAEPGRFDAVKLSDKIYVDFETRNYGVNDKIIMGGVAYPAEDNVSNYFVTYYFADNGEVEFAPSRESLKLTPKTRAALNMIKSETNKLVREYVTEQIKNTASIGEAVEFMSVCFDLLRSLGTTKYKGQVFFPNFGTPKHVSYVGGKVTRQTQINLRQAFNDDRVVVVTHRDRLSPTQKAKFDQYAVDNGLSGKYYLTPTYFNNYFLSGLKEATWEDIMATKVNKTNVNAGVKRGPLAEYKLYNGYGFDDRYKIDNTKPIYYMLASEEAEDAMVSVARKLRGWKSDVQLARVYKIKEKAFLAAYPAAKHAHEGLIEIIKEALRHTSNPDYAQYLSAMDDWFGLEQVAVAGGAKVLDTRFFNDYTRFKQVTHIGDLLRNAVYVNHSLPYDKRFNNDLWTVVPLPYHSPVKDYPLLKHALSGYTGAADLNDIIEYINLLYTSRKGNQ